MTFHFQDLGLWFLLKYMSVLTCNMLVKSRSLGNQVLTLSLHISDFPSPYSVRMQLGKAITCRLKYTRVNHSPAHQEPSLASDLGVTFVCLHVCEIKLEYHASTSVDQYFRLLAGQLVQINQTWMYIEAQQKTKIC